MLPRQTDFLVIGGGIIGITISIELKQRFRDASVVVIEKESQTGQHASGRNSGVLHAGFYYPADSHKARLTKEGNHSLTEYCIERKLPINRCGKLVVACSEEDVNGLHVLAKRGRINGVDVDLITAREAQEIEPRVRTFEQALYSPATATVCPARINNSLYRDALQTGVKVITGAAFISNHGSGIRTSRGTINAGYVINAAGLYADQIARSFGFSKDYVILPFKGLYLHSENNSGGYRCNIYPVPDSNNPFLGVHITVDVKGDVRIGPTAIPAFWRENYKGLQNFSFPELIRISSMMGRLLVTNRFGFRRLAMEESKKIQKKNLINLAARLAEGISQRDFNTWGRPGIRAQLMNTKTMSLEMDFCFEGDNRSFHVLNAVSPAFTCALPFSRLVADLVSEKINC